MSSTIDILDVSPTDEMIDSAITLIDRELKYRKTQDIKNNQDYTTIDLNTCKLTELHPTTMLELMKQHLADGPYTFNLGALLVCAKQSNAFSVGLDICLGFLITMLKMHGYYDDECLRIIEKTRVTIINNPLLGQETRSVVVKFLDDLEIMCRADAGDTVSFKPQEDLVSYTIIVYNIPQEDFSNFFAMYMYLIDEFQQ